MNPPPTQQELETASNRLSYEIMMFRSLTTELSSGSQQDKALHNALVESWAIHLRVLMSFFFEKGQKDDAVAADFVSTKWGSKNQLCKSLKLDTALIDDARLRVNKGVAHITYRRQDSRKVGKEYDVQKLATELEKVIVKFEHEVDRSKLGSRW